MHFPLCATFISLAIASLGLAAPASNASVGIGQRSPNPDDWKTTLGWDGIVTPIEQIGTLVPWAGPGGQSKRALSKRTLGGLYICPGVDWSSDQGGLCAYTIFGDNQCVALSDPYRWSISSVGSDPGTWCILYQSTDCTWGASEWFSNPGVSELTGSWAAWNDNIGSIACWW
ncbi:hypothetical protein BDZ91DRAFT_765624 [Kalaharituber pfeilii]|nr:hypothetical protein BDZ91DRAFT_765624 [Kalaharituber pfeilii]